MGTSLSGLTPANTYQSLIKVGDNSALSATLKVISDGAGNDTPLYLSTGAIQFGSSTGLYWDNANSRLGIGTNAPISKLQVNGTTRLVGPTNYEINYDLNGSLILNGTYANIQVRNSSNLKGAYLGSSGPSGYLDLGQNGTSYVYLDGGSGTSTYSYFTNQLGVGTSSSLGAKFNIKGSGSTSATTSLLVQNSSGTTTLTVNDAGNATTGGDIFAGNIQIGKGTPTGIYNVAMGQYVLGAIVGSSTASYTTAIGQATGGKIGSGTHNVIIGTESVSQSTSISNSVVIGSEVLARTTSAISNTLAIGTGNTSNYYPTIYATNINTDSPNVRIGNNSALTAAIPTAPTASAIFELSSTTKGFLPPQMTTAQKNAIATPAAGLMVYDTTLNKLCVYTTAWETITSI